jgi:hypothetical protein
MNYLIVFLSMGAACACWVLLQRWVIRQDPDVPGVEGGCWGGGCGRKVCDEEGEREGKREGEREGDGDKRCSHSPE